MKRINISFNKEDLLASDNEKKSRTHSGLQSLDSFQ